MNDIKGIFFDLDGVLYIGNKAIDGAVETISFLRPESYKLRFITNTSTITPEISIEKLLGMGFDVKAGELFTPLNVAKEYMLSKNYKTFYPVIKKDVLEFYSDFRIDDINPDCILIGDIGDKWSYELMNKIYNFVMSGSELLALHKGKFYKTEKGNVIDIGAFVTGIEFAANVKAKIFGKPDNNFFDTVIKSTGVSAENILMVGDDIDNDIQGAINCGMKTVLTRTGKYDENYVSKSGVKPDVVIESIRDLPNKIKEIK